MKLILTKLQQKFLFTNRKKFFSNRKKKRFVLTLIVTSIFVNITFDLTFILFVDLTFISKALILRRFAKLTKKHNNNHENAISFLLYEQTIRVFFFRID